MIIRALVHKADEGGFWATVPALPGCATQGETMEELRANLHEAMEAWLELGDPQTDL
jgi:predicted RNase H-like HicB family nuclease